MRDAAHMAPRRAPADAGSGAHDAQDAMRAFSILDVLGCVLLALMVGTIALYACYRPAVRVMAYGAVSLVALAGLWLWLRHARARGSASLGAQRAFPVVLLAVGLLYATFFAPAVAPDEAYHYGMSYSYANALIPGADARSMRAEDYDLVRDGQRFGREMNADFWRSLKGLADLAATNHGEDVTVEDEDMLPPLEVQTSPPQVKLASALGIVVGRVAGLSGLATFYLGRIFNLLFSAALIICAVRLTPVGKQVMMAAALLPMTVHLLGSYSYDAGIVGFSFLLIALLLRLATGEGKPARWELVSSVVVAVLLAPCKVIYVLLGLLALLVPAERFLSRRQALAWKAAMIALPMLGIVVLRLPQLLNQIGADVASASQERRRLDEVGQFYSVRDVVAHPLNTLVIVMRTNYEQLTNYLLMLVGTWLGPQQAELSMRVGQAMTLVGCVALSALPSPDDGHRFGLRARLLMAGICVLIFGAVEFSMLTGWTFNDELVISGVQGRYFLPFLPVLLLALRGRAITAHVETSPLLVLYLGVFDCYLLMQLAFQVLGGFAI